MWCIATTLFSVIVYIQAFVSSEFDPAQILVWTPIILVIDAGSMAQVFFLVIEAKKVRVGDRIVLIEGGNEESDQATAEDGTAGRTLPNTPGMQESSSLLAHFRSFRDRSHAAPQPAAREPTAPGPPVRNEKSRGSRASLALIASHNTAETAPSPNPVPAVTSLRWYRDPASYAAVTAALLFLTVVVMQIVGLVAAAKAVTATSEAPLVSWCSPLFQPFGLAIMDGDCHVYDVSQSSNKGIGCIQLPGVWQRQWLTGTVVATALELAVELGDVLVLALVSGSRRWNGIKLKRPWLTIFCKCTLPWLNLNGPSHPASIS